jgi:hypothetical protein
MVFASGFHIQCLVFHRSHFSRSEIGGHELIKIYIKKFKEEANGIELVYLSNSHCELNHLGVSTFDLM